jgi:hypothetical protein
MCTNQEDFCLNFSTLSTCSQSLIGFRVNWKIKMIFDQGGFILISFGIEGPTLDLLDVNLRKGKWEFFFIIA